MGINYQFTVEENILVVNACGVGDKLEEVKDFILAIVQKALEQNCNRVLCLEKDLEYKMGFMDLFQSAVFVATLNIPVVGASLAIVCDEKYYNDLAFWENVVVNRGLIMRAFTDPEKAREWLKK
jgi:hypothetical protein